MNYIGWQLPTKLLNTYIYIRLGQNRLDNIFLRNTLLLWATDARQARRWRTNMGTSRKVRLDQNRLDNIFVKNTLLLSAPYAHEARG